jgi:DNA polymerase
MRKTTIDYVKVAYGMICDEEPLFIFEDMWESPLEVFASCIRHFIQPHTGNLLDLDYVGVEARIGPWLCGQQDKLDSILRGEDQYKVMASEVAFGVPYDQVTKAQREVGKVLELQCIYGTGGRGMRDSLATKGVEKTLKECNGYVKKFRARFDKYPECWKEMEDAAKLAIKTGKTTRVAGGKMAFGLIKRAGIHFLAMRLPSGRNLFYPHPRIKPVFRKYEKEEMEEDPWKKEKGGYWIDEISFYGKGKDTHFWGRTHTWGSRLFENACQAIGADLLHYGCVKATERGFDIRMIIHDQVLAMADGDLETFHEAMCLKQPWAETFPLAASSAVVPYYLKEED